MGKKMITFLLKLGELTLKGGNRSVFERALRENLRYLLKNEASVKIIPGRGRFFLRCPEEIRPQARDALGRLFGLSGWAETQVLEKTEAAILRACVQEGRDLAARGFKTFKVEARRTDKGFPLDSYSLCCKAGAAILEALPALKVDVHAPEGKIHIEIRERAYVYRNAEKGLGGLPVGTAGRGMLLLSGGIDSPVAGYLMAGRGLSIDASYFHAYPYTSEEARQKALRLGKILGSYTRGGIFYSVPYTEIQQRIQKAAPQPWHTLLLRMAMMEGAEILARRQGAKGLITGESLSQVASQTPENIASTESRVSLPVFRPLIGLDKEYIIRLAEKIGTYETSILPYQDCCALFSPAHPVLRSKPAEAMGLYEGLDLKSSVEAAIAAAPGEQI
jgi:thiamine biosynthesis protein ThiI